MRTLYINLHLYDIGYIHTCITVSAKQVAIARWGLSTVDWSFCYESYLTKTGWDFYPFKLFWFNRCCYQILYHTLDWLNATVTIHKLPNASHFIVIKSYTGGRHNMPPPPASWPSNIESGVESLVLWPTSVPILVFLGLSVLDLDPMYATERQMSDRRQTT